MGVMVISVDEALTGWIVSSAASHQSPMQTFKRSSAMGRNAMRLRSLIGLPQPPPFGGYARAPCAMRISPSTFAKPTLL